MAEPPINGFPKFNQLGGCSIFHTINIPRKHESQAKVVFNRGSEVLGTKKEPELPFYFASLKIHTTLSLAKDFNFQFNFSARNFMTSIIVDISVYVKRIRIMLKTFRFHSLYKFKFLTQIEI